MWHGACSVVRRVIIPDMFYVSDGLCETTLVVLNEMGTYPNVIEAEVEKYLPFLATTELLNAATMKGMNREKAHELIRKHSVAEALRIRETGGYDNKLAKHLGASSEFPLDEAEIKKILEDKAHFVGNAKKQIYEVVQKTNQLIEKYKIEASYEPGKIL